MNISNKPYFSSFKNNDRGDRFDLFNYSEISIALKIEIGLTLSLREFESALFNTLTCPFSLTIPDVYKFATSLIEISSNFFEVYG